jgi:hypothetical protein
MLSESARMSSAAEARFRIQTPNSSPRAIKVIALDAPSERVVSRLAEGSWQNATFFTARDLVRQRKDLTEEVSSADLIVMVAAPGGRADLASMIGEACSRGRVMTTSFVVGVASASDEALSKTLAQLRPWSLMVVIANVDDYIEDMLIALRA